MKKVDLSIIQKLVEWVIDPNDEWRRFAKFYPDNDPIEPYHKFLFHLAEWSKPEIMLELGVKSGLGIAHMSDGNPSAMVYGLDRMLLPDAIRVAAERNNVDLMQGESPKDIASLVKRFWPDYDIGLVHLDTIHTPEQVAAEIEAVYPFLERNGVICIDDIWIDPPMKRYWRETLVKDKRFLAVGSTDLHVTGFGILVRSDANAK